MYLRRNQNYVHQMGSVWTQKLPVCCPLDTDFNYAIHQVIKLRQLLPPGPISIDTKPSDNGSEFVDFTFWATEVEYHCQIKHNSFLSAELTAQCWGQHISLCNCAELFCIGSQSKETADSGKV